MRSTGGQTRRAAQRGARDRLVVQLVRGRAKTRKSVSESEDGVGAPGTLWELEAEDDGRRGSDVPSD